MDIKNEPGFLISEMVGKRVKVRLNLTIQDEENFKLDSLVADLIGVDSYGILIAFNSSDHRFFTWPVIKEVRLYNGK
jgi:hypothetical protein